MLNVLSLIDQEEIIKFIAENLKTPEKIVEVGIGFYPNIALELSKLYPKTEILATDISSEVEEFVSKMGRVKMVSDDITSPKVELYAGADLIYSIRPPLELIKYLMDIAGIVESHLLIRCLAGELPSECILHGFKFYNTGKSVLLFSKAKKI